MEKWRDFSDNRIKKILEEKDKKQKWLSEKTGIREGDLSNMIAGKRQGMTFESVIRIARALGYSIDRIWPHIYD